MQAEVRTLDESMVKFVSQSASVVSKFAWVRSDFRVRLKSGNERTNAAAWREEKKLFRESDWQGEFDRWCEFSSEGQHYVKLFNYIHNLTGSGTLAEGCKAYKTLGSKLQSVINDDHSRTAWPRAEQTSVSRTHSLQDDTRLQMVCRVLQRAICHM